MNLYCRSSVFVLPTWGLMGCMNGLLQVRLRFFPRHGKLFKCWSGTAHSNTSPPFTYSSFSHIETYLQEVKSKRAVSQVAKW